MEVVTVLNQKGGVGKTSTCHHLSGALAERGLRVLLVDNDPQASLSQGLLGVDEALSLSPSRTIAAVYEGENAFPSRVIQPTSIARVDLLPGSGAAARFNRPEPEREPFELQAALRTFIQELDYDLVLIDCPPNLYLASWAALAASQFMIVPVQPEDYGAQGIRAVTASFEQVRSRLNPGLILLGYVISIYNARRSMHAGYRSLLQELHGNLVFESVVPDATDYSDAITAHRPITVYKPRSKPAQATRDLAGELLARIHAYRAVQEVA